MQYTMDLGPFSYIYYWVFVSMVDYVFKWI